MLRYAQHSIIVRSRADLNIIDDGSMVYTEEFVCQQVFSHLEPWVTEELLHDNSSMYSLKQNRTCVNGDLGHPRGCSGAKERTITYFWVREIMTFLNARENCHKKSAKLFDLLDGELSTIEFLLIHMLNDSTFWVGIEKSTGRWKNKWITEDKQDMSPYVDVSSFSANTDDDKYLSISYQYTPNMQTPLDVFYWRRDNETLPSVCYEVINGANF